MYPHLYSSENSCIDAPKPLASDHFHLRSVALWVMSYSERCGSASALHILGMFSEFGEVTTHAAGAKEDSDMS